LVERGQRFVAIHSQFAFEHRPINDYQGARLDETEYASAGLNFYPVGAKHLTADFAGHDQALRPDRSVYHPTCGHLQEIGRTHLTTEPTLDPRRRREAQLAVDLRSLVENGTDLAPPDQPGFGCSGRDRLRYRRPRRYAPPLLLPSIPH